MIAVLLTPIFVASFPWLMVGMFVHHSALVSAQKYKYKPILWDVYYWYTVGMVGMLALPIYLAVTL